ncbi:hypothetical protein VTO73DRAFT_2448 [Trametes versicolor]
MSKTPGKLIRAAIIRYLQDVGEEPLVHPRAKLCAPTLEHHSEAFRLLALLREEVAFRRRSVYAGDCPEGRVHGKVWGRAGHLGRSFVDEV